MLAADRTEASVALQRGPLALDPARAWPGWTARPWTLTRTEFAAAPVAAQQAGRSAGPTCTTPCGASRPSRATGSVDNAILRLRKKLGPLGSKAIETVWGWAIDSPPAERPAERQPSSDGHG